MDYELVKDELKKVKLEEFKYIDSIAKLSSEKILSEHEKLTICRNLKKYEIKINDMYKKVLNEINKDELIGKGYKNNEVVLEIGLDKSYLSSTKNYFSTFPSFWRGIGILSRLGIDEKTFKYKLTIESLRFKYKTNLLDGFRPTLSLDIILNGQKISETPIYVFCGYYYHPVFDMDGDDVKYSSHEVESMKNNDMIESRYRSLFYEFILDVVPYSEEQIVEREVIPRKRNEFEKDKLIIYSRENVPVIEIFEEEFFNDSNKSLRECVIRTNKRSEELSYIRSSEYKEKILLDKINELYKRVKGEFIKQEILYSGNFLKILEEEYKLPNDKIVKKEKIIKNHGKNAVIVIARTTDNKYIITFQNRIKDKMIAEFPSGYIEDGEEVIEAAKRELKEETGYISDDLFVIDYAYTSPGIDNSITYIVIANACTKSDEKRVDGTELVDYGLFSDIELRYFINKDIMNGAMNKLAYYNLINNVEGIKGSECGNDTQKLCKRKRSKTYPYDYQK